MKLVVITGPRHWKNEAVVDLVIRRLKSQFGAFGFLVMTGGAQGVDSIAVDRAWSHGVHACKVHALWEIYGKKAGPFRNGVMASMMPDLVVGLLWRRDKRGGTENMLEQARRLKIPTRVLYVPEAVALAETKAQDVAAWDGIERVETAR